MLKTIIFLISLAFPYHNSTPYIDKYDAVTATIPVRVGQEYVYMFSSTFGSSNIPNSTYNITDLINKLLHI